jgi:hypothetical protein
MKQRLKPSLAAGLASLLLLLGIAPAASAAGTASMYLVPSSGTYAPGAVISVGVYEDSGSDQVNAVQANLTYSTSTLTFSSISDSSAFGVDAQSTGGGGSVQIGRGAISPVSGAQLVATVRFTASAAGSASISFASGSAVVRSSDNQNESLSTSGGSYTVSAPAPPPSSPPPTSSGGSTKKTTSGSTSHSTTPAPSPSPSPNSGPAPAAPTVLTISSISSQIVDPDSVKVSWKTSLDASSEVQYGISTKYILSASDATMTKDHLLALSQLNLTRPLVYHYVVKSVDANGNQVTSKDMTFSTKPAAATTAKPVKKSSSGLGWLWIIILLGLAAAGWYFVKKMPKKSKMPANPMASPDKVVKPDSKPSDKPLK